MTARYNRSHDLFNVSQALLRVCEEVKNGPVVPNVIGLRLQFDLRNIPRLTNELGLHRGSTCETSKPVMF